MYYREEGFFTPSCFSRASHIDNNKFLTLKLVEYNILKVSVTSAYICRCILQWIRQVVSLPTKRPWSSYFSLNFEWSQKKKKIRFDYFCMYYWFLLTRNFHLGFGSRSDLAETVTAVLWLLTNIYMEHIGSHSSARVIPFASDIRSYFYTMCMTHG